MHTVLFLMNCWKHFTGVLKHVFDKRKKLYNLEFYWVHTNQKWDIFQNHFSNVEIWLYVCEWHKTSGCIFLLFRNVGWLFIHIPRHIFNINISTNACADDQINYVEWDLHWMKIEEIKPFFFAHLSFYPCIVFELASLVVVIIVVFFFIVSCNSKFRFKPRQKECPTAFQYK